jgi:hypothetical protein
MTVKNIYSATNNGKHEKHEIFLIYIMNEIMIITIDLKGNKVIRNICDDRFKFFSIKKIIKT